MDTLLEVKNLSVAFQTVLGEVKAVRDVSFTMKKGSAEDIFYHPAHPYTKALLAAVPRLDCNDTKFTTIEGAPPNMVHPPTGCPFEARCKYSEPVCKEKFPEKAALTGEHAVCCHLCKKGGFHGR